jgi:hypothetical protein
VYVGGAFSLISGTTRASLAALSLSTGNLSGWHSDALGSVNALAVSGPTLYAGGSFTQIARLPNANLAGMSATGTSVAEEHNFAPRATLEQNYPNPFSAGGGSPFGGNPTTAISYRLIANSYVTLKVYDVLGKEVATLVNEYLTPGTYRTTWNAAGLPSGVYFYRLQSGTISETRRLLLVR